MTAAHQRRIVVAVRDRITGVSGADTTTPLVITSNQPTRVTGAVDPNDNRAVILTCTTNVGGATITVQENPSTPDPLNIPVTVETPPDLSGVDFVSATQI
jgi:hypothetical protein